MTPIYDPSAPMLSVEEMIEIESSRPFSITEVGDRDVIKFLHAKMARLAELAVEAGEREEAERGRRVVAVIEKEVAFRDRDKMREQRDYARILLGLAVSAFAVAMVLVLGRQG